MMDIVSGHISRGDTGPLLGSVYVSKLIERWVGTFVLGILQTFVLFQFYQCHWWCQRAVPRIRTWYITHASNGCDEFEQVGSRLKSWNSLVENYFVSETRYLLVLNIYVFPANSRPPTNPRSLLGWFGKGSLAKNRKWHGWPGRQIQWQSIMNKY